MNYRVLITGLTAALETITRKTTDAECRSILGAFERHGLALRYERGSVRGATVYSNRAVLYIIPTDTDFKMAAVRPWWTPNGKTPVRPWHHCRLTALGMQRIMRRRGHSSVSADKYNWSVMVGTPPRSEVLCGDELLHHMKLLRRLRGVSCPLKDSGARRWLLRVEVPQGDPLSDCITTDDTVRPNSVLDRAVSVGVGSALCRAMGLTVIFGVGDTVAGTTLNSMPLLECIAFLENMLLPFCAVCHMSFPMDDRQSQQDVCAQCKIRLS